MRILPREVDPVRYGLQLPLVGHAVLMLMSSSLFGTCQRTTHHKLQALRALAG